VKCNRKVAKSTKDAEKVKQKDKRDRALRQAPYTGLAAILAPPTIEHPVKSSWRSLAVFATWRLISFKVPIVEKEKSMTSGARQVSDLPARKAHPLVLDLYEGRRPKWLRLIR
jgi:hypothetical protein